MEEGSGRRRSIGTEAVGSSMDAKTGADGLPSAADPEDLGYDPRIDRSLTLDGCFLCGSRLTPQSGTEEHVFPRWLLRKFNLWDAELNLLNGTSIRYPRLRIPCCRTCNGNYLGPLEQRIRTASEAGIQAFDSLDRAHVYQWLLKMFYGIMFKEMFLLVDRKDPLSGAIVLPDFFEDFHTSHAMLQSIRFQTEWTPNPPWSIFTFECHAYPEPGRNFDFYDSFVSMAVAVRMGPIGVIACLQDNNSQEQLYADYFRKFQSFPLHPIQFTELVCRVLYMQSRQNRVPKYMTRLPDAINPTMQVISLPLGGLSSKPVYDEWQQEQYAHVLAQFTGIPFEILFAPPDQVISWLYNQDGSVKVMNPDDRP